MVFNQKAKCANCTALISLSNKPGGGFRCALDVEIETINGVAPKPKAQCYKPKTKRQLERAKELTDKRNGKKSNDTSDKD